MSGRWTSGAFSDMLTGTCIANSKWDTLLTVLQLHINNLTFYVIILCSYPMSLSMVASGAVNVKQMITHNFSIEKTLEAFEVARTGAGGAIKVMIHC